LSQGKTRHVLDDGRVGARYECGGFFMPNLNEPDLIGALSQRLRDSVDAVARQSEHDLDAQSWSVSMRISAAAVFIGHSTGQRHPAERINEHHN
jgi:hypothetical protein